VGIAPELLGNNVFSGRSFGAVNDVKGYPLAFLQAFKALGLDCGMMDENVLTAILLNKTKTF